MQRENQSSATDIDNATRSVRFLVEYWEKFFRLRQQNPAQVPPQVSASLVFPEGSEQVIISISPQPELILSAPNAVNSEEPIQVVNETNTDNTEIIQHNQVSPTEEAPCCRIDPRLLKFLGLTSAIFSAYQVWNYEAAINDELKKDEIKIPIYALFAFSAVASAVLFFIAKNDRQMVESGSGDRLSHVSADLVFVRPEQGTQEGDENPSQEISPVTFGRQTEGVSTQYSV